MSEHSVVDPMLQHMYLAVAQTHLGSATGATNEWQRALQVANTPEKLLTLANYAEQNSANDIADAAYAGAIKIAPTKSRTPIPGDCVLLWQRERRLTRKRSRRKSLSFGRMTQQPAIRMLTCDCCSALRVNQRKQRSAKLQVLVKKEPRNWLARATLGLARLRLGRNKDALAAFRGTASNGERTARRARSARRNSGRKRL